MVLNYSVYYLVIEIKMIISRIVKFESIINIGKVLRKVMNFICIIDLNKGKYESSISFCIRLETLI